MNTPGWSQCRSTPYVPKDLLSRLARGDGLGSLGDGVLGELSGEDETDRGLDLAGGHCVALVVLDQAAGLAGDPILPKVSETKELRMDMARLETPVSGCTCLRTR